MLCKGRQHPHLLGGNVELESCGDVVEEDAAGQSAGGDCSKVKNSRSLAEGLPDCDEGGGVCGRACHKKDERCTGSEAF